MASLSPDEQAATRRFYDRIAGAYDLIADASEHGARDRGLELLAARPGERVLEVGFGTGHALVALAEAVGPQGRVTGVDISASMCEVARRRLREAGLEPRVDLLVEPVPPLPLPDGACAAAFLSFTLELFPDAVIPELLGELRRVLRPQGRLALVSMAHPVGGSPGLLERAYAWMHRHFPHIVDCRPIDVDGLLDAAGFRRLREERLEIWTLPVQAVLATSA